MKIILISLICIFLMGISSYSFAQYTVVDSDTLVPQVTLQLELRDLDGNFLTYIETEQIIVIYPSELNKFLDNQNHKEILIDDDNTYELIQWQGQTEKFDKKHAYSQFSLWIPEQNLFQEVLVLRHNSYQTQPGDTLTVYWTIIRPAN